MVHLLRAALSRSPELRATPGISIIPAVLAEDKAAQPCSVSVLHSLDFNWEKAGLGLLGMSGSTPGCSGAQHRDSSIPEQAQGFQLLLAQHCCKFSLVFKA